MISDVPLWLLGQANYTSDCVGPTQPSAHFLFNTRDTFILKNTSTMKNLNLRKNIEYFDNVTLKQHTNIKLLAS